MQNTALFQVSLPLVQSSEYGSVVELKEARNGFLVIEREEGLEDYFYFFEDFEDALVTFKHWNVDINASKELKEDGSIGYYPDEKEEDNSPTLFDFFKL
ncbi:ABC transporter ATP-binding protein [Helicobacter sp. MIT 00-7814]|uniref:ABC transporter ATP-binding protein n=1 Tax=unclassified Helicobacter TaxID=2593540 RepID=UPI000E1F09C1|nr:MULTISPECIES: ABC transporter ATP-binding protein [unclassified Helicobacter]RDU51960.1 ABC transporter ATP-binding protein [Helicobacter sp. MIT 00-7814]RDU54130.1 ABC transporter ATP-binding protein [Helicobacter sp. MIT 99-10781]